jgi:ketosteroid isomerase-like protein
MKEIAALEERLRQAELGPDPKAFEELLADDAVLVDQRGNAMGKAKVVGAHQPARGPKFTEVELRDVKIIAHGDHAVVTCSGHFKGPQFTGALKFMRVWLKRNGRWQIVAGSIHQ